MSAAAELKATVDQQASVIQSLTARLDGLERELRKAQGERGDDAGLLVPERAPKAYPPTRWLASPKRILVSGGAGFVGSHLVDLLMTQGHIVYVLDNLYTGRKQNIAHWLGHPNFEFFQHDVIHPFYAEVDRIYHLACPASPPHYMHNMIKTIKCSTMGTLNMLGLAKRCKARLLFTSTSEIYGDPDVHPQPESYWGNVNTLGPRSCYDEGKRVSESMCYAYHHQNGVDVRIARIFNTYGPRMDPGDGRVVSNFIIQALEGKPLTIFGTGSQTRSFQYVEDLIRGLVSLMESDCGEPVNLGNPDEYTIKQFADNICEYIRPGKPHNITHKPAAKDDPRQRKPDITRAGERLGWAPAVPLEEGISRTVDYFRAAIGMPKAPGKPDNPTVWLRLPLDIPNVEDGGVAATDPSVRRPGGAGEVLQGLEQVPAAAAAGGAADGVAAAPAGQKRRRQ